MPSTYVHLSLHDCCFSNCKCEAACQCKATFAKQARVIKTANIKCLLAPCDGLFNINQEAFRWHCNTIVLFFLSPAKFLLLHDSSLGLASALLQPQLICQSFLSVKFPLENVVVKPIPVGLIGHPGMSHSTLLLSFIILQCKVLSNDCERCLDLQYTGVTVYCLKTVFNGIKKRETSG